MRPLEGERLLQAWEDAAASDPVRRPLRILMHGMLETNACDLEDVSLLQRNRFLLELYAASFGTQLHGFALCQHCGSAMEFDSDVAGLLSSLPESDESTGSPMLRITSRMLLHALSKDDALSRERALLSLCSGSDPDDTSTLEESSLEMLRSEVSERNADAEMSCILQCVECDETNRADFDPAHFVWLALRHRASALMADIHDIARAYGWAEGSILAMSSIRREAYLARIAGERAVA
ncbi:hypothetical protein SAMN05444167_1737 [Terriglobus roseus]|uniref:T4 bacteriophage base plate protein n=2 Tax=Terriglobus roseus TaxID=392734 RepID=A0A1G7J9W2_9BACT|nr:hypothetical protein SAMN05444167_1737 [Terriglobus roseus]